MRKRMVPVACLLITLFASPLAGAADSREMERAISTGDIAAVRRLLDAKQDSRAQVGYGMTLLHHAAMKGIPEIARLLIEHGADPNAKAEDGARPLHYASTAAVAEVLLKAGADLNARANDGYLPIHFSAWSALGKSDAVAFYLRKGVSPDVHVTRHRKETPLHLAASTSKLDTVKVLIEGGANVNEPDDFGAGPLFDVGHSKRSVQVAMLLVARGAKVNARDMDGDTPLHYMAVDHETDVVKFLLDQGADPNAKNDIGGAPLHLAAMRGCAPMAELLLSRGAKIEMRDGDGGTPLILASGRQFAYMNTEVAEMLLAEGADPNAKANDGETPLHVSYQEEITAALLKAGADPNAKSVTGQTPLHVVGKHSIARLLVAGGAYVNAKDEDGQTPLHSAASRDNRTMIEFLIANGAEVNAKDDQGRTPLKCCHYKITAEVIRRHGGE